MKRTRAFTLVELLVVIAIMGILTALLLPSLGRSMRKADQVHCLNNLRQIGISLQQFADDHRNRYPMQVSADEGGAREATAATRERIGFFINAVENFIAIERELVTPKLLVCRADQRLPADNFGSLRTDQVSYLLASNALPGSSISALAADRNLELAPPKSTAPRTNATLVFGATLHERRGNVLLADGRVEWLGGLGLPETVAPATGQDEAIPDLPLPDRPGTNAPPDVPAGPPGPTNDLPAARSPAVSISANRTPRLSMPPAAGAPPTGLTTNSPVLTPEPPTPDHASPAPVAFIPFRPITDPAAGRGWWWLLALLALSAWWYLRKRRDAGTETAVRGAPAGMTLQNAVAATGTLAQTAGVKKFFTGAAVNADLLLTMLDKHGIAGRQEFARALLREHEDEFSRETVVYVLEEDYDRAYQLFYAERQDEL